METVRRPPDELHTPVQFLKGVGPARAELLRRLGLETACDLLFFFPRDYEDTGDWRDIGNLEEGKLQTVVGVVEEVESRATRGGRSLVGVLFRGEGGYLRGLWFNQPYIRRKLFAGQRVMITGKPKRGGMLWEMSHPRVIRLSDEETPRGQILPVYPLTEGLQQWQMRRIMRATVPRFAPLLEDVFPEGFRQEHDLYPIQRAVCEIHFPRNGDTLSQARRRFVYQELFVLQVALAIHRSREVERCEAPRLPVSAKIDARIRRLFPFELTGAQKQVIEEIARDMAGPHPMNRLLQGDVGSGKTVVAVYAMLLAVAHGHQAVLMAPTEVLARQHFGTLERLLEHSRVSRHLLIGGQSAQQRQRLSERVAAGEIDIVVGTQAVIQEQVRFHKLGVVVIDEQHKFGVRQRGALKIGDTRPHFLIMSATPIPRTITMILFGDLDVSILRELPPGRKPVHTYLVPPEKRADWWQFVRKHLEKGRQAYVVVPLVEGSEDVPAESVESLHQSLREIQLPGFDIDAVHGRLSSAEKEAVMERFRKHQSDVLVCTSVVEVGIDVPNATVMTIVNAERFGLAQLHQFRGRISRGRTPGYCGVFAESESEQSQERLKAFVSTSDGFDLAEIDFRLRGPGEILGTKQHGLPPFRVADLLRDAQLAEEAKRDAQALVAEEPALDRPELARLRQMVLRRYGSTLNLGEVG